jgi:hypothetical protein
MLFLLTPWWLVGLGIAAQGLGPTALPVLALNALFEKKGFAASGTDWQESTTAFYSRIALKRIETLRTSARGTPARARATPFSFVDIENICLLLLDCQGCGQGVLLMKTSYATGSFFWGCSMYAKAACPLTCPFGPPHDRQAAQQLDKLRAYAKRQFVFIHPKFYTFPVLHA